VRIRVLTSSPHPGAAAPRAGLPGATPGPVAVEDPWDLMSHSFRGESQARGHTRGGEDASRAPSRFLRVWRNYKQSYAPSLGLKTSEEVEA